MQITNEVKNNIIIYTTEDQLTQIDVQFDNDQETIWLNLQQLTTLFDRDKSVISRHLKNIFENDELSKESVVANYATTAKDGKTYQVDYYNLDAIISVGYRVNSKKGTQFRIWATQKLRDYLVKGYSFDGKRFQKNAKELHAALELIKKAAQSPELNADSGRGLVELNNEYVCQRARSISQSQQTLWI